MNDKSDTEAESAKVRNDNDIKSEKAPSDFVVGLVTFIIFIFFMSAWMYFSAE